MSSAVMYFCYSDEKVYAHDFSTTNDALLVTLLEELKVETALVNSNILFRDNVSVQKHAANAAELLHSFNNNLSSLGSAQDFQQIYDKRLRNSTTVALVVANIIDKILMKYGGAFDIGYDLTNMSNMMTTASHMASKTNYSMLAGSQHSADPEFVRDNDLVLANPQDYQTANTLSDMVDRLFNDDLIHLSPDNETSTVVKLAESIRRLKDSVDNKVSPEILMDIVHTQVHPLLQKAYHLRLIST
jgi:ATP-dependent 26S proteasome regulatory subunit